jgi:hypothetical protein
MDDGQRLISGRAWSDYCDRLKALGQRILEEDFPNATPRDRVDGFKHLARMTVYGLLQGVFFDREFPVFFRNNGDVIQWGAPNADNLYIRARVAGNATYRLSGNMSTLFDFLISTHHGDMHTGKPTVFHERTAEDFQIGPDGSFEIILSSEQQAGNWMPLHPDTDIVMIRQFLVDWDRDQPAQFVIEKLGNEGLSPSPMDPAEMARRLDESAAIAEGCTVYWNDYLREFFAPFWSDTRYNVFCPPQNVSGGAHNIFYGQCVWDLGADDALLIECEAPRAHYWSVQLNSLGWYESLDFANHQISLNHEQIRVDPDGRFRIVVSSRDPGIANWLDTLGYRNGVVLYRWIKSQDGPEPTVEVVKTEELPRRLPRETMRVDPAARREQIARRQRHVALRFR